MLHGFASVPVSLMQTISSSCNWEYVVSIDRHCCSAEESGLHCRPPCCSAEESGPHCRPSCNGVQGQCLVKDRSYRQLVMSTSRGLRESARDGGDMVCAWSGVSDGMRGDGAAIGH